jgi:glycosyltransferase involved in cell wall biosynthesis
MRILIVSNASPPHFVGGAELMAHEQAKALNRLGHDVRLFVGDLGLGGERHQRNDDSYEGIAYHRVSTTPEDYSPEYLNFLHPEVDRHFRNVFQNFQPDIVHAHNLAGLSVRIPILAQQLGAKVVCTLHDFWGFCLRNTLVRPDGRSCGDLSQCGSCIPRIHDGRDLDIPLRFRKDFMRIALDHVDRFVAPSWYVAGRYVAAGLDADRLTVIPNGIDLERFDVSGQRTHLGDVRVTYAGYFGTHKGVATLLEARALVPRSCRFTIGLVGEGPEEDAYASLAEALGLGDQVYFLGKVAPAGMPTVYANSDIVVLPSIWDENQPVCLMEAMAAGLPVIASHKGGIPELIAHGDNGFLFAAGDADDLALQIAKLVGNPVRRATFGRRGRERVEAMSHERQAQRVLALYAEVTALQSKPVLPQTLFDPVGPLRGKMSGVAEVLADGEQPDRHFIPRAWLSGLTPRFAGVMLTGRLWQIFRLLGIDAIFPFPGRFDKAGDTILRWIARAHTRVAGGGQSSGGSGEA